MPKVELPIANGSYLSESLPISAQECINWYPNIPQAPALGSETLLGTPGAVQLVTTGLVQQVNRGSHTKGSIPYFVNGGALYSLDRSIDVDGNEVFSTTSLGAITGSGRVSMADNGTQLFILVPGGNGFIYNESSGAPFQQITDTDFTANGNPQSVVFIDGYFVVTTDTKKFIVSSLNDGLSWNALDFGSAEADPDDIAGAVVHSNQLFIFGSQTIEVFRNIGGAGFPFQRVNGLVIPKGLSSQFAAIQANNTFMWIGAGVNESPAIWQFTGNGATKVSTTAIDNALQRFTDTEIGEAFAWSYAQKGAYFVGFTVGDRSFVIDTITGRWHTRASTIDNSQERWRANSITSGYGRVLIGDAIDGRVGDLDVDSFMEYGEIIIRTVTTQPFADLGEPLYLGSIELTIESGVGDLVTINPQMRLSWSDNGKTFSNELLRSMGKIGEYNRRVTWRRLGRIPRFRVLRFEMSEPVKPVIIKAEANIA